MNILSGFGLRATVAALATLVTVGGASAAGDGSYPIKPIELQSWTFSGPFGTFDEAQLQRGFQVYREVCASCHGLELVAFRHLADEGGPHFTEEQVKALAAEYEVTDGPDEFGDMFDRPGKPFDYFPSPFENDQAAASANGGAAPPDLSLITKARAGPRSILWFPVDFFTAYQEGGADYLYALLTSYEEEPADAHLSDGTYYNTRFLAGSALAMPDPLSDELVTYEDGTPETVDQYAQDVTAFLMWAAEPHLIERKRMGFQVMIFLVVFAGLLYLTKKKIWSGVAH